MSSTTHYLRARRNLRRRENAIVFAWFVTRLTIWISIPVLVACTVVTIATIL